MKDVLINALTGSLEEFRMEIKCAEPPAYQVTKAALTPSRVVASLVNASLTS